MTLRAGNESMKPFTAVWISHMLVEIFLLMHPALVPVFMKEFNLSIFEAGLLISVPSLCRLTIVLPIGILADRFGPRRFVILSMLVSGGGALLVSQSTTSSILLLSLSLIMISVTLYHPPGVSIISSLFSDPRKRSFAIGLHGASGCIGQSIGTISLGFLMIQFGWRFSYLLFAVPLLTWMLVLAKMKMPQPVGGAMQEKRNMAEDQNEQFHGPLRPKTPLMSAGFLLLLVSMGLNALANSGLSAFMTTYMTSQEHLTTEIASIIFGAGPLIGIVGSLAAGYFSSKLGERNSVVLIYFGQAIFLLGLIGSPYLPLSILSFLAYQFLLSALWTPATSMVANLMDKSRGGTAYSLYFFSGDALGAISPLVAAILITSFGIIGPFIFAMILLVACGCMVRLIKTR